MNFFSYRDGTLCAENVQLASIAARFGTPCYVYSRAALEYAYREFEQACAGRDTLICYLVSDFRGIEFKPIDFRIEGLKRTVSIPDILSFEIEGVTSRTSDGARAHPAPLPPGAGPCDAVAGR